MPSDEITESDLLNAMFHVLGALLRRDSDLTPQIKVHVGNDPSRYVWAIPLDSEVRWVNDKGEVVYHGAPRPKDSQNAS